MLKEQLQKYFDQNGGTSILENMMSLRNQFSKSFELAGELKNEVERVNFATKKAEGIFKSLFTNEEDELIVLIYEWPEPNAFLAPNKYLHDQFSNIINSQTISTESDKIIIYQIKMKNIAWYNILKAIANTEMGLDPGIDQKIYFFDIDQNIAFHMYDDRGCLIKGS